MGTHTQVIASYSYIVSVLKWGRTSAAYGQISTSLNSAKGLEYYAKIPAAFQSKIIKLNCFQFVIDLGTKTIQEGSNLGVSS